MSDNAHELPPMCVTPDGLCEEGDGPPGADSSTPRDTQGTSPQGDALTGQARHAGNADAQWTALTSFPDFCQVGDKIIGFESRATLGNPVNYSPNVIIAGQRTYRVGDLCQGTEGNDGAGVGSGTSQGSGHVLFLTGQDNVKANGQPVVRDGSECMINCNAGGVGGAKGYVHTNTESVNSQPEEPRELSEAERLQQQAQANLERAGELREALNNNPNGKTAAEAEALYGEVQQLASETRAQQDALMDALREGRISSDDYIESSLEVDEAANRAAGMQQEAERQVRYTSSSGRSTRAAGEFAAEMATPYGTAVDIKDTAQLWSEGRYLAASGMTLLTAVSVIPGVRLLRKADDVADVARSTDRAEDAAGSANRGGTSGDSDGLQVSAKQGGEIVHRFDNVTDFNRAANNPQPNARYEYGTYAWETDNLGRVTEASGTVRLDALDGRAGTDGISTSVIGKEGRPGDVGFHLIGDQFGGPTNRLNVVPGNGARADPSGPPNLNQGQYGKFELSMKRAAQDPVNAGRNIEVKITPQYAKGNATNRPDAFVASYRIEGKRPRKFRFKNQQGG
ncbi:DNA/RNA non-specific endonuclease [Halomonas sp. THAF12]|uniref:DNA/RNA non-specific endonuclease n=1 Tax=Halomonas sp. B23F22_10 TaxID=3459515 RepID=UPI00373F2420